jgi:hypothetical protein
MAIPVDSTPDFGDTLIDVTGLSLRDLGRTSDLLLDLIGTDPPDSIAAFSSAI